MILHHRSTPAAFLNVIAWAGERSYGRPNESLSRSFPCSFYPCFFGRITTMIVANVASFMQSTYLSISNCEYVKSVLFQYYTHIARQVISYVHDGTSNTGRPLWYKRGHCRLPVISVAPFTLYNLLSNRLAQSTEIVLSHSQPVWQQVVSQCSTVVLTLL